MIGAIERLAVDGACDGAILMVGSIEELDDDGLGVALEITLLVGDTDGFDGASFGEGLKLGCRVFFGCFFWTVNAGWYQNFRPCVQERYLWISLLAVGDCSQLQEDQTLHHLTW